jgi:hypothetical protein
MVAALNFLDRSLAFRAILDPQLPLRLAQLHLLLGEELPMLAARHTLVTLMAHLTSDDKARTAYVDSRLGGSVYLGAVRCRAMAELVRVVVDVCLE